MNQTGNPVVAIVEDNELLLDLYVEWTRDSYEVRSATNGTDALAVIDDDVDVVILDRKLPDTDGDEILHRLRKRGNTAQVAMVTAVDADFDILELPFDDYLHKPVTKAAFDETIEQLLRRSQYEQSLRELHELAAKCAALEAVKSDAELNESEEYRQLLDELERARAAADEHLEQFELRDYHGAFKRLSTPST